MCWTEVRVPAANKQELTGSRLAVVLFCSSRHINIPHWNTNPCRTLGSNTAKRHFRVRACGHQLSFSFESLGVQAFGSSLDLYVVRSGRLVDRDEPLQHGAVYHLEPRLCGGKGGTCPSLFHEINHKCGPNRCVQKNLRKAEINVPKSHKDVQPVAYKRCKDCTFSGINGTCLDSDTKRREAEGNWSVCS